MIGVVARSTSAAVIYKTSELEAYPLLLQQSRAVTTHQSEPDPLQILTVLHSYITSQVANKISCIAEVWTTTWWLYTHLNVTAYIITDEIPVNRLSIMNIITFFEITLLYNACNYHLHHTYLELSYIKKQCWLAYRCMRLSQAKMLIADSPIHWFSQNYTYSAKELGSHILKDDQRYTCLACSNQLLFYKNVIQ